MTTPVQVSRFDRYDVVSLGGGHLFYNGVELRLLTGTASLIFSAVDGVSTDVQLAERLAEGFANEDGTVRASVLEFVDQLAHLHLVRVLSAPAEAGYVRPSHIGYVRDGDMGLLADLQDGRRRALSSTGAAAWEAAAELHYASLVVERLQAQYPDAPVSLPHDVEALLDDLVTEGFLVRIPPPEPSASP